MTLMYPLMAQNYNLITQKFKFFALNSIGAYQIKSDDQSNKKNNKTSPFDCLNYLLIAS